MRVALSGDMEGIAGMRSLRELLACCPEYWETGRAAYTADVVAAAEGLLAGGAREVVVLDNHASGNPRNLLPGRLPAGAREETWNVFDLPAQGIDAMLQVGYHPRAGVRGFVPHTYTPGLRLWAGGEEISESHGRAWAARAPLLGITGSPAHRATLGSLANVPFIAVQEGENLYAAAPAFEDDDEAASAIQEFAQAALEGVRDAPHPEPPPAGRFEATLDGASEHQAQLMAAGGWERRGDDAFAVELEGWAEAREPLAAAMGAGLAPFMGHLSALDLSSREALTRQDPAALDELAGMFMAAIG